MTIIKVYDNFTFEIRLTRRFQINNRVYKSLLFKLNFFSLNITFFLNNTLI
jgi:hypothetical protein